ncbi:MAG: hypothetical protein ACI35T_01770 [Alistipes sp.]
MSNNELQNIELMGFIVSQDSRLINLAILSKSVMQINLRKVFSQQEWNLIMNDIVCDTAMQKVITEAQRYLRESNIVASCLLITPQNYIDAAKYIVGIASATILKEYRSQSNVDTRELATIINKLQL